MTADIAEGLQQMLTLLENLVSDFLCLTVSQNEILLEKFMAEMAPLFWRLIAASASK